MKNMKKFLSVLLTLVLIIGVLPSGPVKGGVAGEQTGAKLSVILKAFKELFELKSSFSPRSE